MRKLVIFMPAMEGGGVEKNIVLISNYLSKYIYDIAVISYDSKYKKFFNKKVNFICFTNKTKKVSKYFKYAACLWILTKQFFLKKKIIVFSFQANIYCLVLSTILRFKVISRSNTSPKGWSKNLIKKKIFKIFIKKASAVIVNSKKFQKQLNQLFNIKSTLVYNPLNKNEILSKSKKIFKFKFFDDYNGLKIINIARFTNQKDHRTLIDAFNLVSKKINCRLLLIGYGSNKESIKLQIKSLNQKKNIKILPFKFNPYKYLKKSDIFILCSLYEGLPNVLLEAMVLKKYIISTDCPTGPSEILNNGNYGDLVPMKNHVLLSEKILLFSKNKNKFKNKLNSAYKSLDRFDFDKNCKKYLKIIKKHLND